jgi:DNA-directed RNA polymerase specialized sigma subunit
VPPQRRYEAQVERALIVRDQTMLREEARRAAKQRWLELPAKEKQLLEQRYAEERKQYQDTCAGADA